MTRKKLSGPPPLPPPGRVAQSVTCLATDACLTADPGVASSIPVRSHTLVEIDHEMISTVILLPSADSFKKDCCQLQTKVCARMLVQAYPGKSVVRLTDRPAMTIAVDLGRKATKQTNPSPPPWQNILDLRMSQRQETDSLGFQYRTNTEITESECTIPKDTLLEIVSHVI